MESKFCQEVSVWFFSVWEMQSQLWYLLNVSFVDVVTHQIPKQMVSCHPGVRELAPFGNPW